MSSSMLASHAHMRHRRARVERPPLPVRHDTIFPLFTVDEEFLKPLGLTPYRLAKDIGVPP